MNSRVRMAHLLRRAGFGIAPGELDTRLNAGFEATVQELVESGAVPDGLSQVDDLIGGILDFNNIDDVKTWWIYRMVHGRRPLVEKMAFFWHGHFATSMGKVGNAYAMYQQNQLFRERGLGNFYELLVRVARDPAMLLYLDGASNKKAHPNENFAREVMELFTVGLGPYTEADVQAAARAFTGWGLKDGAFFFNSNEHDFSEKTFLGRTGAWDGVDVLRILAEHPATAEHVCRKLFAFFAYPDPTPHAVAPLVEVWRNTHGNVREVVRALFLSPEFSSARAYRAKVKSPAEFVIGTMRSLGGTITPRNVMSLMARMGQDLFNPPSVKGWEGEQAWISTSTLFERFNFAAAVTTQRGPTGTSHVDPAVLFAGTTPTTPSEMLELAVDHLLDGDFPESGRAALLSYLNTPDAPAKKPAAGFNLDGHMLDEKARGMLHLLLSSPEFQLS